MFNPYKNALLEKLDNATTAVPVPEADPFWTDGQELETEPGDEMAYIPAISKVDSETEPGRDPAGDTQTPVVSEQTDSAHPLMATPAVRQTRVRNAAPSRNNRRSRAGGAVALVSVVGATTALILGSSSQNSSNPEHAALAPSPSALSPTFNGLARSPRNTVAEAPHLKSGLLSRAARHAGKTTLRKSAHVAEHARAIVASRPVTPESAAATPDTPSHVVPLPPKSVEESAIKVTKAVTARKNSNSQKVVVIPSSSAQPCTPRDTYTVCVNPTSNFVMQGGQPQSNKVEAPKPVSVTAEKVSQKPSIIPYLSGQHAKNGPKKSINYSGGAALSAVS